MSATAPRSPVVRRLTDDSQTFAGRNLEFVTKEKRYLGLIRTTDTVKHADGKLIGVAIKMTWMKETEAASSNWVHARESRTQEVYIRAEELDSLSHEEEDAAEHLVFLDGNTIIILADGDTVDPAQVGPHGY
jgi:hypothetical protein